MRQIAQRSSGRSPSPSPAVSVDPRAYQGRVWVTRPRPGVDRMATAWLIRTYIDPNATFVFADAPSSDAVAFDMYGAEFGHHDDRCTFEVTPDLVGQDTVPAADGAFGQQEIDRGQRGAMWPSVECIDRGRRAVHLGIEAALGMRVEVQPLDQLGRA